MKLYFLGEAREFLLKLDEKSREKIIFNIDKAKFKTDRELFKKLKGEIWEFRTLYHKNKYRLFAFWDKDNPHSTLVVSSHGIVKKTDKTPLQELDKAEKIRLRYFELKSENKNGKK